MPPELGPRLNLRNSYTATRIKILAVSGYSTSLPKVLNFISAYVVSFFRGPFALSPGQGKIKTIGFRAKVIGHTMFHCLIFHEKHFLDTDLRAYILGNDLPNIMGCLPLGHRAGAAKKTE